MASDEGAISRFLGTLGRKKTISNVMAEVEGADSHTALKKSLSRWDVVAYGVSSTVGAGIFVITGLIRWYSCSHSQALALWPQAPQLYYHL